MRFSTDMKPLIMLTNDDGVCSPGLQAALEAVYDLGDVLVAAPITQQTGMGRAFPRTKEQGIIDEVPITVKDKTIIGYGVHASPAYAVAHGVMELAERKPALCISGINYGENLGTTVTCSGTLGAVFEAHSHNIPGLAVSLEVDLKHQRSKEYKEMDWDKAVQVTRSWAKRILYEGMAEQVDIYNINIPSNLADEERYRYTRLSRQNYFEFIKPGKRNYEEHYELKSELKVDMARLEKDSDIYALHVDNIVSVTPLCMDMSVEIMEK